MTTKRLGIKILKITGISLAIILLLLVGFHFWFKAHAKGLLEDMVASKSNGKVKLKIEKLHFNYFSRKIELEKAIFYNTDTTQGPTAYNFSVDRMLLQVKAFLPLVFKKQILIDSLTLQSPTIEVTRLRAIEKPGKNIKKDVSIPEELGKVYTSIQDALKVLYVKRFQINDGTFRLINKIDPSQLPLTVSNIHFSIDNLQVDAARLTGNENLLFSENVVLRSVNQNIIFPDGRHSLSFSRFRINLKNRLVEFDSCTIAATKGDSASASFKVFFDALLLTNIDFDTLYKAEVIKADSVYCINPKFSLVVDVGKKKGIKKAPPKLENIIQQLTGDLQLAFVVVTNADFNIQTVKEGVPSSFMFSNNNFEMQGLSIQQDAPKAVTVKSFAMAIRNYENFIKDSSYSVQFDSVLFKDDRITLSNFHFNKLNNGKILNTFSVPQFNLVGLSWDDLVFENKLKANQALMFNPYISYTASPGLQKKGKQNIFESLGAVNEYMDLQQLDIIDGNIDLKLKNNLQVKLNNATLSVKSQSLLKSKKFAGIKNSLTQLNFEKGIIHAGNIDIELHDIIYQGMSGQFGARTINVRNKEQNLLVDLKDVSVEKLLVDEASGNVYAEGVRWQKANVKINSLGGKKGEAGSLIELRDVQGTNTSIIGTLSGKSISTNLSNIAFSKLEVKPGSKLQLEGLTIAGKQLKVIENDLHLSVDDYDITDNKKSTFRQVVYKSNNGNLDADILIPALTLTPHVQPLLNGDIALDGIDMTKPVINLSISASATQGEKKKAGLPKMDISELNVAQPIIDFTQASDSGTLNLHWQGDKNAANFLRATDLHTNEGSTSVGQLKFYLTDFVLSNPKGKSFNTGDGKVSAQIKNIKIEQEESLPAEWSANVSTFDTRDFRFDSIGKSKGNLVLNSGNLKNLNISSSNIINLQQLVKANSAFQLNQLTGFYSTAVTNFHWANAAFNRSNNVFTLDSFSLVPVLAKDSFISKQTFQTDYMTLQTGAISFGPVDLDTYIKDNTLYVKKATLDKVIFTDYKDKQLPFNAGIIKPLAVNMIKNIPQKIAVDTVLFTNAQVEYTEVNEKTKLAGTIPITRMNLKLTTVKNYNIRPIDSLGMLATGYLMDTAWIRLRVKQSYSDSLGGFLMTMVVKPADLKILNPVIIPLASTKIESGFLDSLSMRAIGREYLSWGEMQMFYHDLKIRVLKNGDEEKKGFLTGVVNFLANSFIIKNKNTSRTGNVFFIRQRDKSAINYLIKIAISGMASSVGAKNNKKMLRRYKKELGKRNLPPIDFD